MIYLDHAATTPLDSRVLAAMKPYFSERYGNASSAHRLGREATEALEESRESLAGCINAKPGEIVFTSGGTESDNFAIKGAAYRKKKGHIITSAIEHNAVLKTCGFLESQGFEVTYLPVDKYGKVSLEDLEAAIRPDTFLVSIMHANNEIGTIEPIAEIGGLCREKEILFHTDAVQTAGKIPVDVSDLSVDLLSISSHKIYGPKGVGLLYVREGVEIESFIHGGGHERGLRAGTENIPGVVGFAKAMELSVKDMEEEGKRLEDLRDRLVAGVLEIKRSQLNGHPTDRLPQNAHFTFFGITGADIVSKLDQQEICASAASACFSHSTNMPHVLEAIGHSMREANSSLRLSLGKSNTKEDIEETINALHDMFEGVFIP